MKHLWWLIPFATALVDSIVLVALVTGFAGLVYLARYTAIARLVARLAREIERAWHCSPSSRLFAPS